MDHTYESMTVREVLMWGVHKYGEKITFASSFGAEDVVILDHMMEIAPKADIFFLDTALHFKETYETIERLEEHYQRAFRRLTPDFTLAEQERRFGDRLWERDPDLCCHMRKVEPLRKYLSAFAAWITGIRREQAQTRAGAKKVEWDHKFQLVKINPLVDWTDKEVWRYILGHHLPYNPLHDQNYPSIGCAVCTHPVKPGGDQRSGRWMGKEKIECGLHR